MIVILFRISLLVNLILGTIIFVNNSLKIKETVTIESCHQELIPFDPIVLPAYKTECPACLSPTPDKPKWPPPAEFTESKKLNRIRVIGGHGPVGISVADKSTVKLDRAIIGGLSYDRLVTNSISFSIEVLTNKTIGVGVGIDF